MKNILCHARWLRMVFALAALGFAHVSFADSMELKTEAFREVVVKDKDGKTMKKREAFKSALPGAEVIYVVTYRNTGSQPAEKVVVNNAVPAGLAYVAGSALGDGARTEVSVDQGKTWGELVALKVKGADGKTRAAAGADVTHLRWMVRAPVAPAASGTVTYKAVVK